jgi:hypothetical protein
MYCGYRSLTLGGVVVVCARWLVAGRGGGGGGGRGGDSGDQGQAQGLGGGVRAGAEEAQAS